MNRAFLTGAAALAILCGSVAAHAGGTSGGAPVGDPIDPTDPDGDPTDPSGDPTDPNTGGTVTGTGSGTGTGGTTTPAATIPYSHGSGALVFTLDSLPTGASGTQAFYQPYQDNSALGVIDLPDTQSGLKETVGTTTISFHTGVFHAGGTEAQTVIRTQNDTMNFGVTNPACCSVPTGVQVGIEASTFSTAAPGSIYVNFTDALSYFSVNLYRLSGAFDVSSTVTAYSGLDGTGSILGQVDGLITGGSNFAFQTIALSNLAGARSFTLQGGSALANYDAITATVGAAAVAPLPEPSTWAMFIGGFGLVGAVLRRRGTTVVFA